MRWIINLFYILIIFNFLCQNNTVKFKSSNLNNLYSTALDFRKNGNFNESNSILKKLLNFKIDNPIKSEIYYKIANNYYSLEKSDSSLFFLYKLLESNKKDYKLLAKSYFLIASNYSNIDDFERAKQNLSKSIYYYEKNNDNIGVGQCYNNLGELNFKQNDFTNAISYFKKAQFILENSNTYNNQIVLSNIGASYIHLEKPSLALPYIIQAKKLANQFNDSLGISVAINNLATIYRDLNQLDSSLYYYKKALDIVDALGSKEEKKTILINLSEIYEKKRNVPIAYVYYKRYIALKDQLFNEEKNEFIVETQEKYQAAERKKDLAEMKLEIQKKDAKHKQFIFSFILISIITLLIFGIILIWLRWKSIQQKNKAKIEIITATMHGEENQRIKISQEIHDDLGGILGVCRMLFTKSKQVFTDQHKDLFNRIDALLLQANSRSRAISHELFSPTLKQFGLKSAVEEYINNLLYLNPDLEINFQMLDFRLEEKLELNCFRITQELFTNTIKYANANSISLQIEKIENQFNFTYYDNGIGCDFSNITKGVGLNSIEARVKSFSGKIDYITSNQGFKLKLTIPLKK
ncbi:MAG: tetratricopeptide repeat protein [Flavobacteriia bacterium]|nr:tetratricopeptide repeat protein [Flavobacteriia bacterium]